ncbi:MAG: hypothetical protein OXI67_09740 [Candidatus Poribacteria bacterium]|nr:hypothetical protein [Candidatus Poribacteria bacterium]
MFIKNFAKSILILCAILAISGIVYSFTDFYERQVDERTGYGYIYWEDANTEQTAQAQANVSKNVSNWPFAVNINEYSYCTSSETDYHGKQNTGHFYWYVSRKGATDDRYKGNESDTHEYTGKVWFSSPPSIRVHARARVTPDRDSATQEVDVEF